jgi:glutathione S-transferase
MTIQFYGSPMSSSGRTHLMLEEAGVPYEYNRVNNRDPAAKAEYLKINPGGKIPFLIDGDLRIPESVAINFYLAETYAPALWSTDAKDRARIYSWSLWAISTLQHEALRVLHHTMIIAPENRHAYEVDTGKKNTQRYIDYLETEIPESGFLVGGAFSVADLNVASVLNLVTAMGIAKLGPKVQAWFDPIKARPAWKKVAAQG